MNDEKMTQEELNAFEIGLQEQLFHVMPTDVDSSTGVRIDEMIVIRALCAEPRALLNHRLSYWVHRYITLAEIELQGYKRVGTVTDDGENF